MTLELDDLFEASYKGVTFLTDSTTTTGGRKDVIHEFPNRNEQNIEDLGLRPRNFSITAIISGFNYKNKRDTLLSKLEEGGEGVLIHPFFGQIENVVCRTYSLTETEKALGTATFSIEFALSNTSGLPEGSTSVLASITAAERNVFDDIGDLIATGYAVRDNLLGNFQAAKDKIGQIVRAVNGAGDFLAADVLRINEFQSIIQAIERDINSLTVDPPALSNALGELALSFSGLFSNPNDQLQATSLLFEFGADDPPIFETTAGLEERANNNNILNQSVNTYALSSSYNAAAQTTFTNSQQLIAAEQMLEAQYDYIINNPGLDDNTLQSLTDARTLTQQFFNAQRLTVSQIVPTRTNRLPAQVIAYQYYKDSTRSDELVALNDTPDVSFIEGEIEVLSR